MMRLRRFIRLSRLPRRGERGFTLIEILVVVAILGLLVAIVIPNILGLRNEGMEEAKQTEYHSVQIAVLSIIIKAHAPQLDSDAYPMTVQTVEQCHGVQATDTTIDPNVTFYLDEHLISGKFPLLQAYKITYDGKVTIYSE